MINELLREIRENPEVREEARRLILTDELVAQPEEVRGIAETQKQMAGAMNNVSKALAQVVGQLENMNARLDNDLGELKGSVVENKAERRLKQLVPSRYGLHSPEVVAGEVAEHGPTQRFLEACRKANATQEQIDRLNDTDLIIRARRGTDGASTPVYVVVEVAYALDAGDIVRVQESRSILDALAPQSAEPDAEVVAAIYGVSIGASDRAAAERLSVGVFTEELRR